MTSPPCAGQRAETQLAGQERHPPPSDCWLQLYKDLHRLDKSRQARYKLTYGTAATLESPFGEPRETSKSAGWLTSLPASGLSQIQEHGPMLADAKSVAGMLLNAGGGGLSGGPTATSSFPADVTSNALREGLLGEELVLLRKQVDKGELVHLQSIYLCIFESALVPHLVPRSHSCIFAFTPIGRAAAELVAAADGGTTGAPEPVALAAEAAV